MASPPIEEKQSPGSIKSVAVIGGGVSGLAAAYKLKSNGLSVTLFEADERAGGKIRSASQDGFIWDEGANTMTESETEVGRLITELGLREKQQFPRSQHKRYVVRNGMPQLIPSNPIALFKTDILSPQSKLKIILEPFFWRNSRTKNSLEVSDESLQDSVGQFFRRHFGTEVVDYLVDPFLAGTNAGDPESLSMRHAFPDLWHLEKKFGSIIVGAIKSKLSNRAKDNGTRKTSPGKQKHQRGSFSFHGGMQTLTDMLNTAIGGDNLKLNSKVLSLTCNDDGISPFNSWSISFASNHKNNKDLSQDQSFDAVIMTAPLRNVQEMNFTKSGYPFVLDFLPKVTYLPLSVIITSFKKEKCQTTSRGIWCSCSLKRTGKRFEDPWDELKEVVSSDLRKLLGAEGQPTVLKHVYWKNAFPLYGHDYNLVLEAIDKMERDLPGFFYAGNHRGGLSVGKAIGSGCRAADLVISYLNSSVEEDAH